MSAGVLPLAERSGLDYAAEGVTQKDEASGKDTPGSPYLRP